MVDKITTAMKPLEITDKINEIIDDKADVDLSNLSSAGKLVLDGQYISANNANILSLGPTSSGTFSGTINLSSIIPDNGVYECSFNVTITGSNGTNSGGQLICGLSGIGYNGASIFIMPSATGMLNSQIILPVNNRTVNYSVVFTNMTQDASCSVQLVNYRRIGTNV